MQIFDAMEEKWDGNSGKLSIGFVLAPDFTLLAFAGFLDVLRQAGDLGDKSRQILCSWTVMGPNLEPVTSSTGLKVIPNQVFQDPQYFDYVVIVGGLLKPENYYDPRLLAYLQRAAQNDTKLVGVCTGSFYLVQAGLMKGRKCCVHWYHFQDFIDEFPNAIPVTDEIFIVDGDRITCPGGASSSDLAMYLVEQHLGKARAFKGLRHLLLDWVRPHNHPQMPLAQDYATILDPRVRKAVYVMEQSLGTEPLSLEDIASAVNMSTRQLERLFQDHFGQSVLSYFRDIRLRYGRWLLTNTNQSITAIAYECGFSDGSHFCRWFKALFGCSPTAIRKYKGDSNMHTTTNRQL